MKLLLTVDDFGWTSEESETPPIKRVDAGLALARRFHEAMRGVPFLAGVIPAFVDDEGAKWLRSQPAGLFAALHGWDHAAGTPQVRHEFVRATPDKIRDAISRGRDRVGRTPYYIPPYDAIDTGEADAMWHEGIRYVFASASTDWPTPPSPYRFGKCWMVPRWRRMYGALGWQQGCYPILAQLAELRNAPGLAVATLHLPWEAARDPEFKHAQQLVEYEDMFLTPEEFIAEARLA